MDDEKRHSSLNEETRLVLEQIRAMDRPLFVLGMDHCLCERLVWGITGPILCGAGLRMVRLNQFRWCLREMVRLLRTADGPVLAFKLELCLEKWFGYNLDPELLQSVLCEGVRRLVWLARPRPVPMDLAGSDRVPEQSEAGLVPVFDTS